MSNDFEARITAAAGDGADGALFATMAAAASDLRPAFEVFASEEELADHDRLVGMLWACAAGPRAHSARELREAFLQVWPFNDDDPPQDFDDASPVFHKIEALQPLHHFTYRLPAGDGLAEATAVGCLTACEKLEEFGYEASRASDEAEEEEASERLEELGDDETAFLDAELAAFLRAGAVDVEAARGRALEHAATVRGLLPPWWIKAKSWSPDQLDGARGLQDTWGGRPER